MHAEGDIDVSRSSWKLLARATMLCNHSNFLPVEAEQEDGLILNRPCTGDSSESALLKFMEIATGNVEKYREANRKVFELPFNSVNKYQVDDGLCQWICVFSL